jgi:type II secretory pathway pseudopilin PulG
MRLFRPQLRRRVRRGFTLLETGLTTIIIGMGVVAITELLTKGTVSQIEANDLTIAVNLANSIHELTYNLKFTDPSNINNPSPHWGPETGETLATYNDNDDFDGQTFSPPIDARRNVLSNFTGWSQTITVQNVDPNKITLVVPNATTQMERITVTIQHNGKTLYTESWLNTAPY